MTHSAGELSAGVVSLNRTFGAGGTGIASTTDCFFSVGAVIALLAVLNSILRSKVPKSGPQLVRLGASQVHLLES